MYRVMPFESTRNEPRVAFWLTFTTAGPLTETGAGVSVAGPVTGTTGALVAVGGTGVADAQAETIKARIVRLKSNSLVFIRSSDQVTGHASAKLNRMVLGI
jgi:hypothetical protein